MKPLEFYKTEGGGDSGESHKMSAEGAKPENFGLNLSGKRTEQTNSISLFSFPELSFC